MKAPASLPGLDVRQGGERTTAAWTESTAPALPPARSGAATSRGRSKGQRAAGGQPWRVECGLHLLRLLISRWKGA